MTAEQESPGLGAMDLEDTDPRLLKLLADAGRKWGQMGVAHVATRMAIGWPAPEPVPGGIAGYAVACQIPHPYGAIRGLDVKPGHEVLAGRICTAEEARRDRERQQGHANIDAAYARMSGDPFCIPRTFFVVEVRRIPMGEAACREAGGR